MKTIKMTASITKLMVAIRDGAEHCAFATTYKAVMNAGWVVYEDTYKKRDDGEYGRGYILTDAGRAALADKLS